MDKNMVRLAKITVANLKSGSVNPSDDDIISAMNKAIAKEYDMMIQLMRDQEKLDSFASVMSGMLKA